jgi:hypothetical protein
MHSVFYGKSGVIVTGKEVGSRQEEARSPEEGDAGGGVADRARGGGVGGTLGEAEVRPASG